MAVGKYHLSQNSSFQMAAFIKITGLWLGVAMVAFVTTASATPCGQIKRMEVVIIDNSVMFCLPEAAPKINEIAGIRVVERLNSSSAQNVMWSVDLLDGHAPMFLKAGECFRYGANISGYLQKVSAQKMIPGTYYARINIHQPDRRCDLIISYDTVFSVRERSLEEGSGS